MPSDRKTTSPIRIGIVLPSVNTVVEPFFGRALPDGVRLHASRMLLADDLSAAAVVKMDRNDGKRAVLQLVSCRPAAIAYGCTASSLVQGPEYDRHLRAEISAAAGIPSTTATEALIAALEAQRIRKITIVSPYTDDIDAAEHRYLEQAGFDILGSENFGIANSFDLALPTRDEIVDLVRAAWQEGSDGIVITCLNMNSQDVVEALEAEYGVSVVTATQATLWRVLRLAGVRTPIAGYGRLLRDF